MMLYTKDNSIFILPSHWVSITAGIAFFTISIIIVIFNPTDLPFYIGLLMSLWMTTRFRETVIDKKKERITTRYSIWKIKCNSIPFKDIENIFYSRAEFKGEYSHTGYSIYVRTKLKKRYYLRSFTDKDYAAETVAEIKAIVGI